MEAFISSAFSLNPPINRPDIFLKNGRICEMRVVTRLPCSSNQFVVLVGVPSHCSRQYNLLLACSSSSGGGSRTFPGCNRLRPRNSIFRPPRQASRLHFLRPCLVKAEDSEGTFSGESIIWKEQTLEQELQIAIEEENYAQAAKIRDSLKLLQEDARASVLAANARFYNAFRNGDLAAMQTLWSKGDHVCVVHPGVSGISGYDLVMGSWELVWADYEFPLDIEVKDVEVHVRGDAAGYVKCIEMVKTKGSSWGRQFATNFFERINGQWFICIHHASYIDL